MSRTGTPRIALHLGDTTGIGPELCARVLDDGRLADEARIVVVGDLRVLERGMRDAGVSFAVKRVPSVAAVDWSQPEIPIVDLGNIDPQTLPRGEVSPESGRLTGETLAYAIELARKRRGRRRHLRAPQQGGPACRRLALPGRAQDVRPSPQPPRLLLRDERARQPMDVARHLACLAARGARPDHAEEHRGFDRPDRPHDAAGRHRRSAHRRRRPQSAWRRRRPVRPRGDRHDRADGQKGGRHRHRLPRPFPGGYALHPRPAEGRVRRGRVDVSRPGPDRDQAARASTAASR